MRKAIKITVHKEREQFPLFDDLPTATVTPSRLKVFQASLKPRVLTYNIETSWGRAEIKGRLGQSHASLLEIMQRDALDYKFDSEKRIVLLIDPYTISKSMAKKEGSTYSWSGMLSMIDDMRDASINLYPTSGPIEMVGGKIIARIDMQREITTVNPGAKALGLNEDRALWRVVLHEAWVKFIDSDIHLYYDPHPIAKLTTGIGQAVARFIATHKTEPNGGWTIDGVMEAINTDSDTAQSRYSHKGDLMKDAEGLKNIGILIEDGRIRKVAKQDQK